MSENGWAKWMCDKIYVYKKEEWICQNEWLRMKEREQIYAHESGNE